MGRKSIATTIFVTIILLVLAILIVWKMLLFTEEEFTVDESEQVIITQWGKYVRTIKEPGIYSKVPTQNIHRFKSGILEFSVSSFKFTTKDNKRLVLDTHVRWKIEDPLRFHQRVGDNKYIAQARLEDIVLSETRKELALHTLSEAISVNRELIMDNVGKQCDEMARVYGIRVIDVSIKRADLP